MAAAPYVRSKRLKAALWAGGALLLLAQVLTYAYGQFRKERAAWLASATPQALLAAAKSDPNDAEVVYTAAFRLWQNGKPEEALPLAEKAAKQVPDKAVHQLLLGYLYAHDKRPADALRKYLEALRLDPKLHTAHSSTAQLYLRAGMQDRAIPHLMAALNPDRPDAASVGTLVQAYSLNGDYLEAEAKCRELMPYLPPHDIRGYRLMYRIKQAQGRGGEVEAEMRAFWQKDPYMPRADFYAYLAYIVLDSSGGRRIADAEKLARRALEKLPPMGEAYEAMGMVRLQQGKTSEAIQLLERALSLDARLYRTRLLLAEALKRAGREGDAKAYDVLQPDPGLKERAAPLERRLREEPGNAELRLKLAQLLDRGGDPAAAFRVCYPVVVTIDPDPKLLSEANRCLQRAAAQPYEEW